MSETFIDQRHHREVKSHAAHFPLKLPLRLLAALLLSPLASLRAAESAAESPKLVDSSPAFVAKLRTTLDRHLNLLLSDDGSVASLKGKTADGNGALAFYLMFEITGEQKFRKPRSVWQIKS